MAVLYKQIDYARRSLRALPISTDSRESSRFFHASQRISGLAIDLPGRQIERPFCSTLHEYQLYVYVIARWHKENEAKCVKTRKRIGRQRELLRCKRWLHNEKFLVFTLEITHIHTTSPAIYERINWRALRRIPIISLISSPFMIIIPAPLRALFEHTISPIKNVWR